MAWSKRRNRQKGSQPTVSLTPLIDTALTLLVIFMVATPMMHRGIKIDLPKGTVDEIKNNRQSQDIVVYLDKQEQLYVNGNPIQKEELVSKLQQLVPHQAQHMVIVKADTGVFWGTVHALVETVKGIGGVSCVALASQRPRS